MKFEKQFAFYRIPEWYSDYTDYEGLKTQMRQYRDNVNCKVKSLT